MQKVLLGFGKLLFLILVLFGLVGGGIVLGRQTSQKKPWATQPTPTIVLRIVTVIPTPTLNPTPTASPVATLSAGTKSRALYTMPILSGWLAKREQNDANNMDKVTVTKGDYQLIITESPSGGGLCIYPGETPVPMSQIFTAYKDIYDASNTNIFRRGKIADLVDSKQKFSVCQKNTDGTYGSVTTFGHIEYLVPASYQETTVNEMDSMVGSMEVKK